MAVDVLCVGDAARDAITPRITCVRNGLIVVLFVLGSVNHTLRRTNKTEIDSIRCRRRVLSGRELSPPHAQHRHEHHSDPKTVPFYIVLTMSAVVWTRSDGIGALRCHEAHLSIVTPMSGIKSPGARACCLLPTSLFACLLACYLPACLRVR